MSFPHRHARVAALAALTCGIFGPAASEASGAATVASIARPCANANAKPGDASQLALDRATFCLLNRERTSRGLARLRFNRRLTRAARSHSRDMVRKRYFGHVSKSGGDIVDRLRRTGYLGRGGTWVVGENIAWGAGSRSTPRRIMRAWMRSSGHRANILQSRYREIGIGVIFDTPVRSGPRGGTYTTTFGARG